MSEHLQTTIATQSNVRTRESIIVQSVKIVQLVTRTLQSYHKVRFLLNDTWRMKMLPTIHGPIMVHLSLLPYRRQVLNSPTYHKYIRIMMRCWMNE